MPLRAINQKNENIISYIDTINENDTFKCPSCKTQMFFINPKTKIKHFRHKNKKDCGTEPETEEHMTMKQKISEILTTDQYEITIEKTIENQIADIHLLEKTTKKQIVIECQCSKISYNELKERTKKYSEKGISVLWIFGEKNYFNITYQFKQDGEFMILMKPNLIEKEMQWINRGRIYYFIKNNIIAVHIENLFSKPKYKGITGKNIIIYHYLITNESTFNNDSSNSMKIARFNDKKWWKPYE